MSDEQSHSGAQPPHETYTDDSETLAGTSPDTSSRPNFMTVGNGSISASAARLTSLLENDSGYGGSIGDATTIANGWYPDPEGFRDTYTPPIGTPIEASTELRRGMASHVHQLYYNQNRTALARAITKTVDSLSHLQEMNTKWPAHYPSVQSADTDTNRPPSRPGLKTSMTLFDSNNQVISNNHSTSRPTPPKRAETSIGESSSSAEASASAAKRPVPEPRLVTPQLARDFSVLKIDLKMGNANQTDLVHSLEKGSISALLDGQIGKTIRHLQSIRERIEDTASKVLVTGDLNAGKSTFCNALLRRKVLPEDQQPCTSIFCEVLDVRDNAGIEEVHAVPVGQRYNRNDESTYEVFQLSDLDKIVGDNETWAQCKIYIRDIRSVDESLLSNGVVDIALIDAPGLNHDSVITTANFAKQEEIDVVIFVVSAANHFTQSAKEFVFNAAREKAYIFMVVNGYDNIKDKKKCQEMILKQVHHLSPATFKEAGELVHFVASNDIPTAPGEFSTNGGGSSGSGPGGPDGDDDDDDPSKKGKGKGKDKENMRDFAELEASLRRFVLEKRARSKLAPAKTYLLNLTADLDSLATVNRDVAQAEIDRVNKALSDLEPQIEESKKATNEAGDGTDSTIEDTVTENYNFTRDSLNQTISGIAEYDFGIEYPGLLSAYSYAEELKLAMLDEISNCVANCEEHGRQSTISGVNAIRTLGILHLGSNFPDFSYRPENMFRRKKDALARQVDIEVEFFDLFDLSSLWERQEKVAGTSMAVTVAGVVGGRMIGGVGWMDGAMGVVRIAGSNNLRRLIVPGIVAGICLVAAYTLSSIPNSLPRRLSAKLAAQLSMLDYTHANATRISAEVRRALKYPADTLRVGLKRNHEKMLLLKTDIAKTRSEAEVARKFFTNLVRESAEIREGVRRVDLEGPPPGLAPNL
jgi:GTP-binding protein EngB required for normal cell division